MLKRTNNLKFTILMTAIACLSIFLAACTSDETGNQDGDATSSEGKISIEVMESGWDNTPTDENDPYKKWLDETFDVDFKLSPVPIPDLESSLLTRFASQDPPDLIYSHDLTFIEKLYNQGVLYDELDGVMD